MAARASSRWAMVTGLKAPGRMPARRPNGSLLFQKCNIEGAREEAREPHRLGLVLEFGENDFHVAAEFPEDLAAGAAGRRESSGVRDDGDAGKFRFALGEGFENGHALGADREAVGRVFDIRARVDRAGGGLEGGPDLETGELGAGVDAGAARGGDEVGSIHERYSSSRVTNIMRPPRSICNTMAASGLICSKAERSPAMLFTGSVFTA